MFLEIVPLDDRARVSFTKIFYFLAFDFLRPAGVGDQTFDTRRVTLTGAFVVCAIPKQFDLRSTAAHLLGDSLRLVTSLTSRDTSLRGTGDGTTRVLGRASQVAWH